MSVTLKATGLAVLLFALAGCASQSDNSAMPSNSPTATPSVSTSAVISPVVIPDCSSSQLTIIDGRHGVAMGNVGVDGIAFKNISTTICRLAGYPNLQMLDTAGNPIATYLNLGTSYTVQSRPLEPVTLLPNGEAMFDLGYTSSTGYGTAYCPTSAQVLVTPPNSNHPISTLWKMQPYGGNSIAELRCGEITVSPVYAPPAH